MQFSGQVVIVTGGGAGIGKGIAQCFAREGARVAIADWNEETGARSCAELAESGAEAVFIQTNVQRESDIEHAVDTALKTWGRIDVLVNNVGTHLYKNMLDITTEEWDRLIATDLRGHWLMSKKVLPHMMGRKKGSIVHIASVHAWQTRPAFTLYAAAKGGIVSMTRAMALECAPYGIRVNAVLPGYTVTSALETRLEQLGPDERETFLRKQAYNIPLGRLALPQEIGNAVVFLAGEQASFITGASLAVDGGETIHLDF